MSNKTRTKKEPFHWVGFTQLDFATMIAICNAVGWEKRSTARLKLDALAMAIKLEASWKKLFPNPKKEKPL